MMGFFGAFNLMQMVVPIVIFCVFVFALIRSISLWHKNNRSPRLTVNATVVSKRMSVSRHKSSSSNWYYVTFQVDSGDRMELRVDGTEYGMLVERDCGELTFQGTRYIGFGRKY